MSIVVQIKTDTTQARDDLGRFKAQLKDVEDAGERASKSMGGLGKELSAITKLAGAAGIGMVAREVLQLADAYTLMQNRLQGVTKSHAELRGVMDETFQIAQRTRSEWAATNEAYVRITNATKEMGLSQRAVLGVTETISKAIQMSGASSTEASAGMLQLTQALASGKLAGDEFRSVSESIPMILDVVAKQMGVSRGALKELASEGKITSEVLIRSFQSAKADIDAGFAKTAPTLAQSWEMFKNEMTRVIGESGLAEKLLPLLTTAAEVAINMTKQLLSALEPVLWLLEKIIAAYDLVKKIQSVTKYLNPMTWVTETVGAIKERREEQVPLGPVVKTMDELTANTTAAIAANKELDAVMSKMLKGIKDPMKDHELQLQALDTLWKQGKISVDEYNQAVAKVKIHDLDALRKEAYGYHSGGAREQVELERERARYLKFFPKDTAFENYPKLRESGPSPLLARLDIKMAERLDQMESDSKSSARGVNSELSREEQLFNQIHGATRQYHKDLEALNNLWAKSRITALEYNEALAKIGGYEYDPRAAEVAQAGQDIKAGNLAKLSRDSGVDIVGAGGAIVAGYDIELRESQRESIALANQLIEADKKWSEAMGGVEEKHVQVIEKQKQLNANTAKFLSEIDKLRNARDPMHGVEAGFNAIGNEVMDVAKLIETSMVNAFHKMEDALVQFVRTGELSLSGLLSMIADTLARLAVRQAIGGVAGLFDSPKPAVGAGDAVLSHEGLDARDPVARRAPGGGRVPPWLNSDAGQEAVTNIAHKQNGAYLATRDRLRSRS